MAESPSRSEKRQEQILTAAQVVFARKGFDEARMDDIVAESGLSKGALYWYFKSKDDIIAAIFHRFFEVEIHDLEDILNTVESAEARLSTYTHMLLHSFEEMFDLIPIVYEFYARATRSPDLRSTLQDYYLGFHDLFVTLIQQGIQAGEYRSDTDVNGVTISFMAAIEGLFFLFTIHPFAIDLHTAADSILELTLDGIRIT